MTVGVVAFTPHALLRRTRRSRIRHDRTQRASRRLRTWAIALVRHERSSRFPDCPAMSRRASRALRAMLNAISMHVRQPGRTWRERPRCFLRDVLMSTRPRDHTASLRTLWRLSRYGIGYTTLHRSVPVADASQSKQPSRHQSPRRRLRVLDGAR